jgi:4-alpha-glucanotransferase
LLLHPTSLPGPHGVGDLGPSAYRFADFLAEAGMRIWQMLPLGPTGYGDSPYQCFSAFAGNPMLISLDRLVDAGYLSRAEISDAPAFPPGAVDFGLVIPWKMGLLRLAAERFFEAARESAAFEAFCSAPAQFWLSDFARFMALKRANGMAAWREWTIDAASSVEIAAQKFFQFEWSRQWAALKAYANARDVRIMGDIPIYVASDSAEVWARPEFFRLDVVAGVPPDYFSATGQLWGNPIYRWDRMKDDAYRWWIERFEASLRIVDMVRLDHFRGFYKFWQVPATETTAVHGEWGDGPRAELFRAVQAALGELPIVAENLGVITAEVEAIREEFHFPGMRILQFAFGSDLQSASFLPHNYVRNTVAYTGTHDNDTTVGWWTSKAGEKSTRTEADILQEREYAREYLGLAPDEPIHWAFIRAVLASIADTAIVPVQDVLGLGSEARMNAPGTSSGNWVWRLGEGKLGAEEARRLRLMSRMYGRCE